jgi:GNAT superfamily N-acetyltransferase
MVAERLLELFDAQMRRPNQPDGCLYVGNGWSAVIRPPADGDVESLVARMREIPGWVEWKYYSHDLPADLPERLVAAGLAPEDEETVVVAEAASIPPPPGDVDLREDVDAFSELAVRVFGRSHGTGFPKHAVPVVAYVDGQPVSGGRVDLEPGVEFAGLFGGVTLPEYRGRGLYRATVARRAELAREAGYRWLYVDALPTSRPILERLGFATLTTTTPYVIPRAAR